MATASEITRQIQKLEGEKRTLQRRLQSVSIPENRRIKYKNRIDDIDGQLVGLNRDLKTAKASREQERNRATVKRNTETSKARRRANPGVVAQDRDARRAARDKKGR